MQSLRTKGERECVSELASLVSKVKVGLTGVELTNFSEFSRIMINIAFPLVRTMHYFSQKDCDPESVRK